MDGEAIRDADSEQSVRLDWLMARGLGVSSDAPRAEKSGTSRASW